MLSIKDLSVTNLNRLPLPEKGNDIRFVETLTKETVIAFGNNEIELLSGCYEVHMSSEEIKIYRL
jgi:hypothetical protein